MAQISRSTRGVVLLLCELQTTRRVMSEAKRLNMVGGHFIWLWIDTSLSVDFFDPDHVVNVDVTSASNSTSDSSAESIRRAVPKEQMSSSSTSSESSKAAAPVAAVTEKSTTAEQIKSNKRKLNDDEDDDDDDDEDESDEKHRTSSRFIIPIATDDDFNEREVPNFNQGFDPFGIQRRQDQQPNFEYGKTTVDHTQPANRLIFGLRDTNERSAVAENPSTGGDKKKLKRDANIFISNLTNSHNESENINLNRNRNFSDDNLLYHFIDNNNDFDDENSMKLMKRMSSSSSGNLVRLSNGSSFVLYHEFKDFPIGLLALRPIRMNIDRHFVRAAVRLFASTWAKIDAESMGATHHNRSNEFEQSTKSSTRSPIHELKNRNRPIGTNQRANWLKNERSKNNRKMRRKRHLTTVNPLIEKVMKPNEPKSVNKTYSHRNLTVSEMIRKKPNNDKHNNNNNNNYDETVNEHLPNIRSFNNNASDLHKKSNSSSTSNIVQVQHIRSYNNQNLSGLIEHNSTTTTKSNNRTTKDSTNRRPNVAVTKKSSPEKIIGDTKRDKFMRENVRTSDDNDDAFDDSRSGGNGNDDIIENDRHMLNANVRQASEMVFANYMNVDSGMRANANNKRQNTWWATKKEPSEHAHVNNVNTMTSESSTASASLSTPQQKCETPHYIGGCYGNANKQDVKNAEYFAR